MILQALKEYYDRKPDLPRQGWEFKTFNYLVRIKDNGDFFDFCDIREGEGRSKRGKEYLVPSLGEKKGNGIKANLFWENIEYLFGIPVPTENNPNRDEKRVEVQHKAFIDKINEISGECSSLRTVRMFMDKLNPAVVQESSLWAEILKANQPILIAIVNQGPVTDNVELRELIENSSVSGGEKGLCLITGSLDEIAALEPPIRGVRDANPTGASLVSINNKVTKGGNAGAVPAFASFMKEQGYNSPIGKVASFAYTTALNYLMRRDSPQKLQMGDATTVFWSARPTHFEEEVISFFNEPPKDDPHRGTRAVADLLLSVKTGAYAETDKDTRFYVLGLSPNSARISVRFWKVGTVPGMASHFAQHFEDLRICHGPKEREHLSLKRLLKSVAAQEDEKNIPPNLAGETMRAILEGLPYPQTLLQAAIRRIRAEHEITYPRAALIKGCLNRLTRRNNPEQQEEIKVSLDINNMNIGYRLGRLFAALEKVQVEAHRGRNLNSTIRNRYYGAASSNPSVVFGTLLNKLNPHHMAKLPEGLRVIRDKLIREIVGGVDGQIAFPPHLTLEDQGRFAVGYYHQMQDFYTKKEK